LRFSEQEVAVLTDLTDAIHRLTAVGLLNCALFCRINHDEGVMVGKPYLPGISEARVFSESRLAPDTVTNDCQEEAQGYSHRYQELLDRRFSKTSRLPGIFLMSFHGSGYAHDEGCDHAGKEKAE
jgi:hypothetical protein